MTLVGACEKNALLPQKVIKQNKPVERATRRKMFAGGIHTLTHMYIHTCIQINICERLQIIYIEELIVKNF